MEIFLNLVWLSVCIALCVWWASALRDGRSNARWNTAIAVCLLLLMLFPVISMTDDLVAMNAPAEVEHTLRRHEASLLQIVPVAMDNGFLISALFLLSIFVAVVAIGRPRPFGFASRLREGFVRASGLRPPPAALVRFA